MKHPVQIAAALALMSSGMARPQQKAPEIPRHVLGVAEGADLQSSHTVSITASSRRPQDPATRETLEQLQAKVMQALEGTSWTAVPMGDSTQLQLEAVYEPHLRYGEFHSQNAPYIFLLVHEPSSGRLLYCSYERLMHLSSASSALQKELRTAIQNDAPASPDQLAGCAAQAMRPF